MKSFAASPVSYVPLNTSATVVQVADQTIRFTLPLPIEVFNIDPTLFSVNGNFAESDATLTQTAVNKIDIFYDGWINGNLNGIAWVAGVGFFPGMSASQSGLISGTHPATLTLSASLSPSQRVTDGGELVVSYLNVDFSITAADLVVNGSAQFPQRGDVIYATIGGTRSIYVVRSDSSSREVWEWTDSSKTRFRVHTNLLGPA